MFQGLLKRAENTIDQVVSRYVGRAMVAVPLLVAAGFATAAVSVKLVELYGAVTAYAIMAALFSVITLITMAIVGVDARKAEEAPTETSDTAEATENADQSIDAADLLTPEVRAILASAAPMALPVVARGVGKNLPLIFILAIVGYLISRFAEKPTAEASAPPADAGVPVPEREQDVAA